MSEARRLRAVQGGAAHGELQLQLQPSDEQLIEGLVAGYQWAADQLYDRLHVVVARTLRRVLQGPDDDYDDLMQVAFERIVRTLVKRRFSGACSLTTWASAIAGHVAIDSLRARTRERRVFNRDRSDFPGGAELPRTGNLQEQLEARADIEHVQAILTGMKPEQSRTVLLHDVLGHELSEIAVLMGVSVAAAQSRLVRGRKELMRRARARLRGAR